MTDRPSFSFSRRILVTGALALGIALALTIAGMWGRYPDGMSSRKTAAVPQIETTGEMKAITAIPVSTRGLVRPARSGDVSSAVHGKIEWINPALRLGGRLKQGDTIVMLSKGNYEAALAEKQAELEQAKLDLAAEQIETMKSVRKHDSSGTKKGSESDLVLRLPNRRLASSRVEASEAAVKAALEALQRTSVNAPYDCTVSSVGVDIGSVLRAGDFVCSVYSSSEREVLLPVPAELLAFLHEGQEGVLDLPVVIWSQALGDYAWWGKIRSMKDQLDPRTLNVPVMAVIDPSEENPAHLTCVPVNLPVEAKIEIPLSDQAYVIPAKSLVGGDKVWVVDASGRLAQRKVAVTGSVSGNLLVKSDEVRQGDILCSTIRGTPQEGMQILNTDGAVPKP